MNRYLKLCIIFIVTLGFLSAKAPLKIRLDFKNIEGASYYQLHWLPTAIVQGSEIDESDRVEKIERFPAELVVPEGYNYFRLRTYNNIDLPGQWGEVYPVQKFIKKKPKKLFKMVNWNKQQDYRFLQTNYITFDFNKELVEAKQIYYKINRFEWARYDGNPITVEAEGEYKVEYYTIDKENKQTELKTMRFFIDRSGPDLNVNITSPHLYRGGVHYFSRQSKIEISAKDDFSGIENLYYQIRPLKSPADDRYQIYLGQIDASTLSLKEDTTYVLRYYGVDKLKNKSVPKKIIMVLDNTPPECIITGNRVALSEDVNKRVLSWQINDLNYPVQVKIYDDNVLVMNEEKGNSLRYGFYHKEGEMKIIRLIVRDVAANEKSYRYVFK